MCDRTQREAEGEDVAGRRDQKEKEITGIVNKDRVDEKKTRRQEEGEIGETEVSRSVSAGAFVVNPTLKPNNTGKAFLSSPVDFFLTDVFVPSIRAQGFSYAGDDERRTDPRQTEAEVLLGAEDLSAQ